MKREDGGAEADGKQAMGLCAGREAPSQPKKREDAAKQVKGQADRAVPGGVQPEQAELNDVRKRDERPIQVIVGLVGLRASLETFQKSLVSASP